MLTLTSALQSTIRLHAGRPAVLDGPDVLTWSAYGEAIARAAAVLVGLGLRPGDRVGILARNSALQGELIYGGFWSGVIPVPLNTRLSPNELAQILADADCGALAVDPKFLALMETPQLKPWTDKVFVLGDPGDDDAWPGYPALKDAASPLPTRDAAEDDDALMLYTSGTTSGGKGVRISHKNLISNALQAMPAMNPTEYDVLLHSAPMFHAAEFKSTGFMMMGAAHAYLPEFSPKAMLQAIQDYRCTVVSLVPTTILRMVDEPAIGDFDVSSLRMIAYGTSPILPALLRRATEAFPNVGMVQCYGLTECSPYIALLDEAAHRRGLNGEEHILSSAGRPVPGCDIRIMDDDGNEVPAGEIGEVVVRGPQVTLGYRNRPEEEIAAFRPDGLRTGDVGRLDAEGFLYLLDRKRDMVISGGENVYTREVEEVLGEHPNVQEVSVIGVPHHEYGEALFAVIVPTADVAPVADELVAYCRERLGGYKIPRRMAFVQSLPKSAIGKVLKQALRKTYADAFSPPSLQESA